MLNRRAVSYAGDAACSSLCELIWRGSMAAARGEAYCTSTTVTSLFSPCGTTDRMRTPASSDSP